MNKWLQALLAVVALVGCAGDDPQQSQDTEKGTAVQQEVAAKYMNEEGFIHAYPDKQDSAYLSESIGLYMQYLVEAGDAEAFAGQFRRLQEAFITEEQGGTFVRWVLYENSNVNALIDDMRLIRVLREGAERFGEPAYRELADRLASTLLRLQQTESYPVDYYDWSIGQPAQRITLSYLIDDPSGTVGGQDLLENVDETELFFPEYYDFQQGNYVKNDEVHMIDQLLIAINRADKGLSSDRFDDWLLTEWNTEGKVFGRYDRNSLQATVPYESLAVYYFLQAYFERIGEPELAEEVTANVRVIASEHDEDALHFFDYIHYQLLLQKKD
ncbi:hypothetical protein [Planococcus lenghuensis]|uniref:Uncharacterized protein n=1 Tax=Planococcus lenghuensis TaxID=2213202 RepID=A0A1Q2L0P2_9BACL|nr:hypothetical protein [Planococcus lenghuensis]AQQ54030.1 hypothetical protein B0X71_13600 [Planococcus lenghuensis]